LAVNLQLEHFGGSPHATAKGAKKRRERIKISTLALKELFWHLTRNCAEGDSCNDQQHRSAFSHVLGG